MQPGTGFTIQSDRQLKYTQRVPDVTPNFTTWFIKVFVKSKSTFKLHTKVRSTLPMPILEKDETKYITIVAFFDVSTINFHGVQFW